MKQGLLFDTGQGAGKTLGQVLRVYANTAYPQNGSECSRATRDSLLQLAGRIADAGRQEEPIRVQRRQLPMVRSAIEWYFSEVQKGMDHVRDALLARLG